MISQGRGRKTRLALQKDYERWKLRSKELLPKQVIPKQVIPTITQIGNKLLPKQVIVAPPKHTSGNGFSEPKDNIKDKIKNNNNAYALLSVFDKTDPCANEREIFEFWNRQKIIRHREFERFKPHIKKRLRKYTKEEIKQAIANYALVLKSKEYFWSYKWSLDQFLTRKNGLDRFLPGNFSKEDFLVRSPPKRLTREEQIDLAFERFEKMRNGGEKKDNDTSRF